MPSRELYLYTLFFAFPSFSELRSFLLLYLLGAMTITICGPNHSELTSLIFFLGALQRVQRDQCAVYLNNNGGFDASLPVGLCGVVQWLISSQRRRSSAVPQALASPVFGLADPEHSPAMVLDEASEPSHSNTSTLANLAPPFLQDRFFSSLHFNHTKYRILWMRCLTPYL